MKNIQNLIKDPKNIFLLDGFGALLTAVLLFFVLRTFNSFFGLSKITLVYLSLIAFIFFIYSSVCFFLAKNNWKLYLKIICTANILYCILTFGILIYNFQSISIFGIAYFLGEIVVIGGLVFLEIKTIKQKFI
ncbi:MULTISPECIES: hypothetical protein [unclassified Flavobacterium]|uniref:hypothetical protein n=1 Tax=unclassified Flavobacterium TaxID=196869 RepID=UPI000935E488|nr:MULTISPECIES: hypothetical protein [unclassified Flavobacterium]